jgi:formiminotetrahydrofolate cyclodeaminase
MIDHDLTTQAAMMGAINLPSCTENDKNCTQVKDHVQKTQNSEHEEILKRTERRKKEISKIIESWML